ncbi:hypothetical protein J2799_002407 [Chryseobacterium vietnamense]|nr:hypothetical protein [Chryseobacterium vietnamense]
MYFKNVASSIVYSEFVSLGIPEVWERRWAMVMLSPFGKSG